MIKNIILTFVFLTFLSLSIATDTNSTKLNVNNKELYANAGKNSSTDNYVEVEEKKSEKKEKTYLVSATDISGLIKMVESLKSDSNFTNMIKKEVAKNLETNKTLRKGITKAIVDNIIEKIKRSINPPREKEDNSNEKDDSDF